MPRLKTDKLSEIYHQRIPAVLSDGLSRLTPDEKKKLSERILVVLAKAVHDHRFDPNQYLTEDNF